jgi:hypothetical protein
MIIDRYIRPANFPECQTSDPILQELDWILDDPVLFDLVRQDLSALQTVAQRTPSDRRRSDLAHDCPAPPQEVDVSASRTGSSRQSRASVARTSTFVPSCAACLGRGSCLLLTGQPTLRAAGGRQAICDSTNRLLDEAATSARKATLVQTGSTFSQRDRRSHQCHSTYGAVGALSQSRPGWFRALDWLGHHRRQLGSDCPKASQPSSWLKTSGKMNFPTRTSYFLWGDGRRKTNDERRRTDDE